ncbi:ATP-dependent DNA ligase [ANMV-1 virus]|nr:ATP-dependent DNA ligase [ANMV-1 virus]
MSNEVPRNPVPSSQKKDEDLAPVNPSDTQEGEEITLEQILPFFKSFYKSKPYVSLVGGLANNGRTKGDIDVFIRSNQEDVATEFRIYRMFPDELRNRIHILYPSDDNPGVYTNYIDLFDLKLEGRNVKHVELMSAIDERKGIKLFTFTKLLKPEHGRYKGEVYTIDNLIGILNTKPEWYEKGIYVQKKFDGVHVRCDVQRQEGRGFSVRIWTEEGNDITRKLPTLAAALGEASKGHAMALVGELEFWKDKEHQSRQSTTAIIHTKEVHPEENKVVLNVFDMLFYNKDDIHKKQYSKRLEYLKRIETSEHVKAVETRLAENETDLKNAVKRFAEMPGSEGAYLKRADFPYELDGKTQLNYKYKNTFSIDAKVQDVHEVKGGKSWNYRCSIEDVSGRAVAIGRTYNTGIKLNVGDIVKVEFVNLNKYFDTNQKKVWYNWWSPRVIIARKDRKNPDNIDTADKLVKASHGEDKNRKASLKLDADPYMSTPDEAKTWLGMLHIHGRGKSVHGDLMFQVSKDWTIKWTLYIPKGLSKVPGSYTEFVALVKKEIMPIVEAKLKDPTKRFNCGKSDPKPAEWLDYRGMVQPGEVGATKNEPGFFYIADRFDVEFGAQKPHYHEYFCNGTLFNGRFCVRLLENREEWKRTGEGLMTWMAVAAKDKTPYVISSRAVAKKWIPGFGHSALPKKMKQKVPKNYKYWNYRETSKQREVRDELVKELSKKLVEQDALGPAIYKVFRQTWKGPTVIREGPARTRYYFAICQATRGNVKFALTTQNNPLENKELAGVMYPEATALCELSAKLTDVAPKSKLNTTQDTPSKIELLETGTASILSNTNFRRFRLRDGKLEGTWIAFQREEGSTIWTLKRANPE